MVSSLTGSWARIPRPALAQSRAATTIPARIMNLPTLRFGAAFLCGGMFSLATQKLQHVRHPFHDSIQRLYRAFGGAGEVDDQYFAARSGDGAREGSKRSRVAAFGAHQLADAGNFAVDYGARSFGRDVARGDSSAAGGENRAHLAGAGQGDQTLADEGGVIGNHVGQRHVKSETLEPRFHSRTGRIFALSGGNGIAHGDHGGGHAD